MSLGRASPAFSLPCSKDHKQTPPIVFRRPPSGNARHSGKDKCSHNDARQSSTMQNNIPNGSLCIVEDDREYVDVNKSSFSKIQHLQKRRYDVPASLPSSFSEPQSIISSVEEALARAASLSDIPVVAECMSTRMAEEACDDELVMKIEGYLSHVYFREYRKTQHEIRFLQATSFVNHLSKLHAITSLHILSIAETLVFTIDQPMRIQGIVTLFASAGSNLCRAECVARTTEVIAKLKEASLARHRNELLRRYH